MGSIYALIALGFVLIYKSTAVINFAQGELLMFGAYLCLTLVVALKIPFWLAFLATLIAAALLGLLLERLFLRPMIGEPAISIIMLTIGLGEFSQRHHSRDMGLGNAGLSRHLPRGTSADRRDRRFPGLSVQRAFSP